VELNADGYSYTLYGNPTETVSDFFDYNEMFRRISKIENNGWLHFYEIPNLTDLGNLRNISGNVNFINSKIKSLGKLQSIGGSVTFTDSEITSLGHLRSIGRGVDFSKSKVKSLGNLRSIGGYAFFSYSEITSLDYLQSIGGSANFTNSKITSLGELKSIGSNAFFQESKITSLGKLQSIGGDAYFMYSKIKSLGELRIVKGNIYISGYGNLEIFDMMKIIAESKLESCNKIISHNDYGGSRSEWTLKELRKDFAILNGESKTEAAKEVRIAEEKAESERIAKEAKAEAARIAKAAEEARVAKEKVESERIANEAKAEEARIAKAAKPARTPEVKANIPETKPAKKINVKKAVRELATLGKKYQIIIKTRLAGVLLPAKSSGNTDKTPVEKLKEGLGEIAGKLEKVSESGKKVGIFARVKGKVAEFFKGGKRGKGGGWVGTAVILLTVGSMAISTYASASSGEDKLAIRRDIDEMLRGEGGMELAASMAISAGANDSEWLESILVQILQKYSVEKQEEFYEIAQEIKEEVQTAKTKNLERQKQIEQQMKKVLNEPVQEKKAAASVRSSIGYMNSHMHW
jgi:hypothetical protein